MGEDFTKYFTTEVETDKGWEVVWTSNDIEDAIAEFRRQCKESFAPVRLTTPTDRSIYG